MKLKKWIKFVDPLADIVIYTQDSKEDEPAYEGSLLNMPWYYMDMEIGREDDSCDEPIYISMKEKTFLNGTKSKIPIVIINLIEK